jgi:hypothetical protein
VSYTCHKGFFFLYHFQGISRVLLFFSIQWHSGNFMDF